MTPILASDFMFTLARIGVHLCLVTCGGQAKHGTTTLTALREFRPSSGNRLPREFVRIILAFRIDAAQSVGALVQQTQIELENEHMEQFLAALGKPRRRKDGLLDKTERKQIRRNARIDRSRPIRK